MLTSNSNLIKNTLQLITIITILNPHFFKSNNHNMPPKKSINFKQQIENSQKFLQKLQTIKKTSKDIKEKNKLTQHRNFWVKEYQYLARLERDMEMELGGYFEGFDRVFEFEYEEREVFKETNYKSYTELRHHIDDNYLRFQAQTFKQVQSLPLLANKLKTSPSSINPSQLSQILTDISSVLSTISLQTQQLQQSLSTAQDVEKNLQEDLNEDQENFAGLRQLTTGIKGFDMEKEKIRQLKESEENLMNYLECFNDRLSEDEIYEVINQFNRAGRLLQETYQLQQQKLQLDYEQALRLNSTLLQSSENFHKISHIYTTYIGRGKSVQLYFERLSIEFPKTSRKDLQLITSYIQAKIYKEKKQKAMKRNYYREKEQLLAKVEKEIQARVQLKIERARKKAQELERKEERLKLQKQLEVLRADYNKRKQEKEQVKRAEEAALKEAQRKKQALRKLYLDQLAKKAEQVHEIKTHKQLQQKQQLQAQKHLSQLQKKKKIIQNKPKVQLRQSIQRKKIQKKVQQRDFKQKLPQIQAERIKNAIQSYKFRPQVQFSQQRLNKPTQAMIKKKQTVMDMADKVQLSKMTGYTVNQLMTDMRFKVNMALQQAGLSHTDYARELLVSMSKKPTG